MRTKKIICTLLSLIIACGMSVISIGCDSSINNTPIDISSLEELYAMDSKKSYRLTCDLDLQGRDWTPLSVKAFDGNGHTISNVAISKSCIIGNNVYFGFLATCERIENVTFDGVTVNAASTFSANFLRIGAAVGEAVAVRGVAVTNAYIDVYADDGMLQCGGIVGNVHGSEKIFGDVYENGGEVSDCRVDKCEIVSFKFGDIGGIAGDGSAHITKCTANGVKIDSDGMLGGVIGYLRPFANKAEYKLEDCSARDCDLKSDEGNVGGLVGTNCGVMKRCLSENNAIAVGKQKNRVGGLVGVNSGKATDCLSRDNAIVSSATGKGETSYFGGFAGTTNDTVRSCVAYGNKIECHDSVSYAAGFAASVGSTVSYCASEHISWAGNPTKFYSFAPNVDYLVNCYAYGGDPIIDKVATIIGDEEFLSVEWLKENLKLDDEVWSLKDGSKPSFNI